MKSRILSTKIPEHKKLLEKRIASLAAVGGNIKVAAATDAEALPLKHKIEDAVFASQAALRFGYVEGGGYCLKKIADELYANDLLIKSALYAPYEQIKENAGGKEIEMTKDIIDPARAVELEVEHGFEVAANLITCKAIVPEFDERDPAEGEKKIAEALMTYTLLWGKREGLIQEGKMEAELERLQKHESLMAKEND